jgi:hypothetical protein
MRAVFMLRRRISDFDSFATPDYNTVSKRLSSFPADFAHFQGLFSGKAEDFCHFSQRMQKAARRGERR